MSAKSAKMLTKIGRAMERGSLPHDLDVSAHADFVTLRIVRGLNLNFLDEIDQSDQMMSWVRKNYPTGAAERRSSGTMKRKRRRQRAVFFDQWVYRAHDAQGAKLSVTYLVPHEHRTYRGFLNPAHPGTGKIWSCTDCGAQMTKTQMRELELIV